MANISVEKIRLKSGAEWTKKITYSKGMFRIKLPEEMCVDMKLSSNEFEISANSEGAVDSMFSQKMRDWQAAIEVITKVIIFNAKFQGALLKKENWENWCNGVYRPYSATNTSNSESQGCWEFFRKDINWNECPDLGLTLVWGVYEKKEVKGKIGLKFLSGRNQLAGMRGEDLLKKGTEIPYSAEREKFFLDLDESFARMISKVYKALGDLTPEKLLELADSGVPLLK